MAKTMKEKQGMNDRRKFPRCCERWVEGAYLGCGVGPDLGAAGDVQRIIELLVHL